MTLSKWNTNHSGFCPYMFILSLSSLTNHLSRILVNPGVLERLRWIWLDTGGRIKRTWWVGWVRKIKERITSRLLTRGPGYTVMPFSELGGKNGKQTALGCTEVWKGDLDDLWVNRRTFHTRVERKYEFKGGKGGFPTVVQQKWIWLASMRIRVQSLASLSVWGSGIAVTCGVDCRHGSDPVWLWLWWRLAAVAMIRPLAWELPYATGVAINSKQPTNQRERGYKLPHCYMILGFLYIHFKLCNF